MLARSAEIAFILAVWSPTSLATFLAKSVTRLAAIAARSIERSASSSDRWDCFLEGAAKALFDGVAIFAPTNHTPAAKPTASAMHAQSKFTNRNVPIAAGRIIIVLG